MKWRVLVLLGGLSGGRIVPALAQQGADSAFNLRLNVPAFRLDARRDSTLLGSMSVAVGQRAWRTPLGQFRLTSITWNPWWHPPASAWAVHDTVMPPCPTNPVGRVKLSFGNGYYIHGTPSPSSVGHPASHGCVRARQDEALALAQLVVTEVLPESLDAARRNASESPTRSMGLARPVPLIVVYQLAEVRGDTLWMYPDIYHRMPATSRRMAAARRVIEASGRSPISEVELRRLVGRSRRAPAYLLLGQMNPS